MGVVIAWAAKKDRKRDEGVHTESTEKKPRGNRADRTITGLCYPEASMALSNRKTWATD